ncbi:MAG: hypothetical protein U0Z75_06265 [Deinococcaceae bacterium]
MTSKHIECGGLCESWKPMGMRFKQNGSQVPLHETQLDGSRVVVPWDTREFTLGETAPNRAVAEPRIPRL